MKKKIIYSILIIVSLVVTGYLFIFIIPKYKQRNPENEKAILVQIDDLAQQFEMQEALSSCKYLNKTLEFIGVIDEIETNQQNNIVLYFKTSSAFISVICTLQDLPQYKNLKVGEKVEVKAVFDGFLSNLIFSKGFIVTND